MSPTLSMVPSPIAYGEVVTVSWSGFRAGYTILLESVSGPGTLSSMIGDTSSGSITSPAWLDVGVWVIRARQPSPEGELYSNSVTFTVTSAEPPTEEAVATVVGIRVLGDGVWYNVYPEGQQAKSSPGTIVVAYGAKNIGVGEGLLYGRILGPDGTVIKDVNGVPVNYISDVPILPGNIAFWEPTLAMPAYNLSLEVQVSEKSTFAGAATAKIGVTTEEMFDLWTQFIAFSESFGLPVPPKPPLPALPV